MIPIGIMYIGIEGGVRVIHETHERAKLEIQEVPVTFDEIYKKPYFPMEYGDEIKRADALLIPYDSFGDVQIVFPEGTRDFFDYLRREAQSHGMVTDICISDNEFQMLELHADVINIPTIILQYVVLPIATGLISSYLYEKVKLRRTRLGINVEIIVESAGKSKKISYEGDADKFEQSLLAISETLFGDKEGE